MTLDVKFKEALEAVKGFSNIDNMTKLRLYALYKQATEGDVTGSRPGFSDMVGRAKWDAWEQVQGISTEEAQQQYIDLIESLK